jgi:hypothetical protein
LPLIIEGGIHGTIDRFTTNPEGNAMLNRVHYILLGCGAYSLFALGCSGASTPPVTPPPAATQEDHSGHDHGDHAGHDHSAEDHGEHAASGGSDIAKALSSLSVEDRAAAEKQKTCLVGGEPLGSMGAPVKVTVLGRDVFVCCEGCTDALKADPETFLAKHPQE